MNKNTMVYIITNSYPEKRVMFNTYEFNYVLKNYKNFKILSFSKHKNIDCRNDKIIKLKLLDGIKEFFFPKILKSFLIHFKMIKYIKSKKIIELGKNIYSYLLALSILRNVDIKNDDMVFSYWLTRSSLIAFYLNKLIGIKYICQGHGSDIYIYPPEKTKEILDNSEVVITVANNNKKFLCKKYDISEEKIKVFRLGVSNDFYNQILEKHKHKKYKQNDGKIRFITVARYETVKGIDLLLEAINLLVSSKKIDHNVEFNIFGDGSKFEDYKNYIEKNDLKDYVNLNGWINRKNLAVELVKADCYILPSRSEGLPVALMEACAAALPIIATNVGSVSEIAINEYNAIICKDVNASSISESIYKFINFNKEKIKMFSENSFNLFIKNYVLEKNLEEKYKYIQSNLIKSK